MGLAENTFLQFGGKSTFCGFGGKCVFDEKVRFAGLTGIFFFFAILAEKCILRFWRKMCIFGVFDGKSAFFAFLAENIFFAVLAENAFFRVWRKMCFPGFGGKIRFSVLAFFAVSAGIYTAFTKH